MPDHHCVPTLPGPPSWIGDVAINTVHPYSINGNMELFRGGNAGCASMKVSADAGIGFGT
jgi:hypothetical protein